MTYPRLSPLSLRPFDRRASAWLGLATTMIAVAAMLGWYFHMPALTSGIPGLPPMQPITALSFMLAGMTMILICQKPSRWAHRLSATSAVTVFAVALLSLFQSLLAIDLGFDVHVLLPSADTRHPHGMAPHTALVFLLLGVSMLGWKRTFAPYMVATAAFIVLLALIGYIYHVTLFFAIDAYTGMSPPTILAFACMCLGLVLIDRERGPLGPIYTAGIGGVLLRRMWPTAAMPIVLSWLRQMGERAGMFGTAYGGALMATLMVLLLTVVLWRMARLLNELDADLRSQRQWMHMTLAGIGDAVVATDTDGRITFMNPTSETLAGWSWKDAQGKPISDVIKFIDENSHRPRELPVMQVLQSGSVAKSTDYVEVVALDGTAWPIEDLGTPIRDESGKLLGTVLAFREISDRRRAEKALERAQATLERQVDERTTALRASEELYRRTLQALTAHIAVIDRQGNIVATNQAWSEFARRNSGENLPSVAVGANYLTVCRRAAERDDKDAAEAIAGIEAVLAGSLSCFTMEYPCDSPKEERWFYMTVVPLGNSTSPGAVISHLDISDRKHAERQIRRTMQVLRNANDDLERFNRLAVGREHRVIQLKEEINALCLRIGEQPRYLSTFESGLENSAGLSSNEN